MISTASARTIVTILGFICWPSLPEGFESLRLLPRLWRRMSAIWKKSKCSHLCSICIVSNWICCRYGEVFTGSTASFKPTSDFSGEALVQFVSTDQLEVPLRLCGGVASALLGCLGSSIDRREKNVCCDWQSARLEYSQRFQSNTEFLKIRICSSRRQRRTSSRRDYSSS
jgi:hypothetical protein